MHPVAPTTALTHSFKHVDVAMKSPTGVCFPHGDAGFFGCVFAHGVLGCVLCCGFLVALSECGLGTFRIILL